MWKSIMKFGNELHMAYLIIKGSIDSGKHIFCLYLLVWRESPPNMQNRPFSGSNSSLSDRTKITFQLLLGVMT